VRDKFSEFHLRKSQEGKSCSYTHRVMQGVRRLGEFSDFTNLSVRLKNSVARSAQSIEVQQPEVVVSVARSARKGSLESLSCSRSQAQKG
jgi:hypothetical protein